MIVDTSALIAVLKREDGYEQVAAVLGAPVSKSMAAGTLIESVIVVVRRYGSGKVGRLLDIVEEAGVIVVPTEQADARFAAGAYARFGKGMNHPARLNFGDCITYALAKRLDEPILCVGNDFAQTDISLVPLEST